MNDTNLKSIIEGFIFASDKAMSVDRLLSCFPENEQPEKEEIVAALDTLQQDYTGRGIELNKVSSGYRFQVRKEFTPLVSKKYVVLRFLVILSKRFRSESGSKS